MNLRHTLFVTVALLSMLAGVLLFEWIQPATQTGQGDALRSQQIELKAIPLTDINGVESTLSDWRDKALIVNFWAPWCLPCRREVPALIEIQQRYAKRGVRVLGIALDARDAVTGFAEEYQINYPLFLAGNRISMYNAAFANPSGSLPFTLLLDRDLKIRYSHNGEVSLEQLSDQLDRLDLSQTSAMLGTTSPK